MPLVDDRGRLFGTINLIDLALLIFLAVLLPLGYGAYLVFRTPPPRITAVTPNTVTYNKGEQRVRVTGEHLRPFTKAALGNIDARAFLVERQDAGELLFIDLPPGTYDLVLFDESQEVTRLPKALTVTAPPSPPLQIIGWFTGPTAATADIANGMKLGSASQPSAEILDVGAVEATSGRRAATLRVACEAPAKPCTTGGSPVAAGTSLPLAGAGESGPLSFLIDEVRVDSLWTDVKVRLVGLSSALSIARAGDVDSHADTAAPSDAAITHGAVFLSLGDVQDNQGSLTLTFNLNAPASSPEYTAHTSSSSTVPVQARPADVRLPVDAAAAGWRYRDSYIRPGSVLTFETRDYSLRGLVLSMSKPDPVSPRR